MIFVRRARPSRGKRQVAALFDATLVPFSGEKRLRSSRETAGLKCRLRRTGSAHQDSDREIGCDRRGHRQKERSDKCRPKHAHKNIRVKVIVQTKMKSYSVRRRRTPKRPAAKLVFAKVNGGHGKDKDIMNSHRNSRSDFVAAKNPGHRNGQQRLQRIQRHEPEKDSDRRPERDGMRSVRDRHQRQVMRSQPAFLAGQELGQTRPVTSLRAR
jgi:hypothetical protein